MYFEDRIDDWQPTSEKALEAYKARMRSAQRSPWRWRTQSNLAHDAGDHRAALGWLNSVHRKFWGAWS